MKYILCLILPLITTNLVFADKVRNQKSHAEGQAGFSNINLSGMAHQDLMKSKETADAFGYKGTNVLGELNHSNLGDRAEAKKHSSVDSKSKTTFGEFLVDSNARAEAQKTAEKDAITNMIKEGHDVSQDPQKHFKVGAVRQTKTRRERVQKTCRISSDFELKTRISLKYKTPDRVEKDTVLTIYYPEYIKNVGHRNDEIGGFQYTDINKQVNIQKFRTHACPHFKPVDAVTKKTYKINCERIKNFSMVSVPDHTYIPVTDKYGLSFHAVRLIKISYKHDTYQGGEALKDAYWSFKTDDMSDAITKYNCALKKEVCLDKAPRKSDELELKQPCWEKELTYDCGMHINTCSDAEGKGCVPKSKRCLELVNGVCALFEKTYDCPERTLVTRNEAEEGDLPFCWSGSCHEMSQEDDKDFGEVAAKLGVLQDMQDNLERSGNNIIGVFKGDNLTCSRYMLNFLDCCGTCKGWGKSLGLNKCSAEEQALSLRRSDGHCRYIGQYCAEKIPVTGVCIRKKNVFCCFGSKLARVFQEKGRAQLGVGWGTAKCPNCREFTLAEMEGIKWDKMDLSEVFSDIAQNIKPAKGQKKILNAKPTVQSGKGVLPKASSYKADPLYQRLQKENPNELSA